MHRDIDITIVRAFLAVVETGSVTRAAELMNLSQGAISQQIKRLEQLSGHALFARAGRRLILSPEGRNLTVSATQLVAANDQLWASLRQPVFQGEVRFGAPYDIIGSYTPPILRRFSKAFPAIRVTLICQDSVVLLSDLKAGNIDLALTTELGCGKGGETLRSDRLVWAGARGGEAHRRDPLPVSLGADACVFRPIAIAALRKARREWLAVCEVSNMEPVRATLEADLAVAPLLGHSVPDSLEILTSKSLPKLPTFKINLYQVANPKPVVLAFADHARRCIAANL
ncbi:LysR family transcriptional regulator [Bradyrhizobium prioriisuperbiae]|uniref:LysR family transcriptional regulator n=1 Tax=Bradyrhizobium prioriisuperbiae TaxID=2854389 RepID=UPI0028F0ED80|nr:LysR family transcriptional regulator [Bradyrhizobium prioritasuperba]